MSKLIKPDFYVTLDDARTIERLQLVNTSYKAPSSDDGSGALSPEEQQAMSLKLQILKDAEEAAEQQIAIAVEEAERIRQEARDDADRWWQERRLDDERHISDAQKIGFDAGFQEGLVRAEAAVRQEYADRIAESQRVLEQSYEQQSQIVRDSEPFLIELSCGIAEKIVRRQLAVEPDWIVRMTREVLARKRERGLITLCVAPSHFSFFLDAREDFQSVIDSQAELQIVPDVTVADEGCVIRTPFGSVDARIDTQLKEIKGALKQMALAGEGAAGHE